MQLNEPGLFRENSTNMGGFNVVYHEPVDEARKQGESNTSVGSSYREFSEADNAKQNTVRARTDLKPTQPTTVATPTTSP